MHGELAESLFQALRSQDAETFRPALDTGSTWQLHGRSALAGLHRGPEAVLAILTRLAALRPIHEEAYDVTVSDFHAVLTTRLVAEGLDSDHAFVIVASETGQLDRAFQYVFDLYAFDEYFRAS